MTLRATKSLKQLALIAAALALATLTLAAQAATFFQVYSAGDSVGTFIHRPYGPPEGQLTVVRDFMTGGIHVVATQYHVWNMYFQPPGGALAPGVYRNAVSAASRTQGQAAMDVSSTFPGISQNTCAPLDGGFTIHEVVYTPDGQVARFAADFGVYCGDDYLVLLGGIRFNSAIPYFEPQQVWPVVELRTYTEPGEPLRYADLPWPQVRASIDSGRLTGSFDQNSIHFVFDAGVFRGYQPYWNLDLAAPDGLRLTPGIYDNAQQPETRAAAHAGLAFGAMGQSCSQVAGRFIVNELESDAYRITKLSVDFEQHCDGSAATLRGTLRVIAAPSYTPPPVYVPPAPAPVTMVTSRSPAGNSARIWINPAVASCTVASASFLDPTVTPLPAPMPRDIQYPYGFFDIRVNACGGQPVTFTVDVGQELPPTAQWWKYGPTPDNKTSHWYAMPSTVDGTRITFTVTDGDLGDDDLTINGTIGHVGLIGIPGGSYQDLWWSGPTENGWGMSVIQHRDVLFANVFVYDAQGNPTWYVMPSGSWNEAHTAYEGGLYRPKGSPYYAYDASRFDVGAAVGTARLTFSGVNEAAFDYSIDGMTGRKQMTRLSFGPAAPPTDVPLGDLWWGGLGQNGWGLAILQQHSSLFGLWFTYDADGKPTWFVMPDVEFVSKGIYRGTLYKPEGPAWLGVPYDASKHRTVPAGSFSLRFDGDSALFDYSFSSKTSSTQGASALSRLPF